MNLRTLLQGLLLIGLCVQSALAQPAPTIRPQAPWPPAEGKLRVIIDTDAANEVDDQYAITLALGFPERIQLLGIVAAHFGEGGGPDGIDKSLAEVKTVLAKAGKKDSLPVLRGIDAQDSAGSPGAIADSDGLELIIEQAMASTPDDPLWLVALGPATDAVAALRKEPRIAERMVVLWHSRSQWPRWCRNFNARNDPAAAGELFAQPSRLVLFDTGAQLSIPLEESRRRIAANGRLGQYLHDIRGRNPHWLADAKGMYDLGDVAALIEPTSAKWERVAAPRVTADLAYDFSELSGMVVRIEDFPKSLAFDLLEQALLNLQRDASSEAPRTHRTGN